MPLVEPGNAALREKILIIGGAGAGKTTTWLSIAWWAKQSGDTRKFVVMDTDDEAVLQVMSEPKYDGMLVQDGGNVEVHSVVGWEDYADFSRKAVANTQYGDWIVLDFVSHAWGAAQDGFLLDAVSKTRGKVLYKAGVEGASGWDMFKTDFNWCVDTSTEILTQRGWKRYDQLLIGEDVLALDRDWTTHWEPLRDLFIGPSKPREMVHLSTRVHDSLTTPDHRWPNYVSPGARSDSKPWTTSSTMPWMHRITISAPHRNEVVEPKYSDAFVETVAWYWNEGSQGRTRQGKPVVQIFQSLKNADNCASIRACLDQAFPEHWKETRFGPNGIRLFRVWMEPSTEVFDVLEEGKIKRPRYSFLNSLTHSQLLLFIETCIKGDGSARGNRRVWYQSDEESVRRFEYVCVLAGLGTRTRFDEGTHPSHFGSGVFAVNILNQKAVTPVQAARFGRRAFVKRIEHNGTIWCPSLDSEIWLARRNGTVFFTGNSAINGAYYDFIKPILLKSRAHVFMTAEEEEIQDNKNTPADMKEHMAQFGKWKPANAQKKLPYQCRTYLRLQRLARGRVLFTLKDRARQELNGDTMTPDFFTMYLKNAGWTIEA